MRLTLLSDPIQEAILQKIGLELKTPFNRRIIYGCCPTGVLSIGKSTEDNIDL